MCSYPLVAQHSVEGEDPSPSVDISVSMLALNFLVEETGDWSSVEWS